MKHWILFMMVGFLPALAQDVQTKMRVILREARIHVVDKDGKPVRGLSKDAFILKESGQLKELSYFEEVDYSATADTSDQDMSTALRPRRTSVFVLDTANMNASGFKALITATQEFIEKSLGPNDLVKLVQMDGKAVSLTRFTNDKQTLLQGLERAEYQGTLNKELSRAEAGIVRDLPEFMRLNEQVEIARRKYESADDDKLRAEALQELVRYENDRRWPQRTIDMLVEEKERYKATSYRAHYLQMMFIARMLAPMDGTRSIYLLSGGLYLENDGNIKNTGEMAAQLGSLLNAYKITVYSIQQDSRILATEGKLQMGGIPVNINILKKMPSLDQGFSRQPDKIRSTNNTVLENRLQSESGIRMAAAYTGGIFKRTVKGKVSRVLGDLHEASSHFYVLGYQGQEAGKEKESKLKITLVDMPKGARLLYGSHYARKTLYKDMTGDEREVTFKADLLYSISRRDGLLCQWDYYLFRDPRGGYRVSVTGSFPLKGNHGAHDIGFTALNDRREPLDYSYTSLKNMPKQKNVSFYDVLLTNERPHFIRFAVRSLASDEISIEELAVEAPLGSEEDAYLSDLVPMYESGKTLPLNELRGRNTKKAEKEGEVAELEPRLARDPFRFEDKSLRPNGIASFGAPETVDFFFHMQNFKDPEPDLWLQFMLKTEKEVIGAQGATLVNMKRLDEETLLYHCRLNTQSLAPDSYEVWVKLLDSRTEKEYMSFHKMKIVSAEPEKTPSILNN